MATPIYEILDADAMALPIFCGGMSRVGVRLFGTWAGTAKFYASANGVNFVEIYATPFASGTAVKSSTANGNWFLNVGDWVAFKVVFTRTSGSLGVALCAAVDSSWQNAFLTAPTIFVNSETGAIAQTAQANRAWNLQECVVSVSGPMPGSGSINVVVWDGAIGGTVLFKEFLGTSVGSVGTTFVLNLPKSSSSGNPGVTGTPGNAMNIQIVGKPAGVTAEINAKFSAA